MNNYNVNFKGYSNVIGHSIDTIAGRTSFAAMKLDNLGKADLEMFKQLQALGKKVNKNIEGDVLVISSYEIHQRKPFLEVNDRIIIPGKLLRKMEQDGSFSQEEAFTLKAYTLIANLMKKLKFDTILPKDESICEVINYVLKNMSQKIPQQTVLNQYLIPSFFNRDIRPIAEYYLNIIDKDMAGYF